MAGKTISKLSDPGFRVETGPVQFGQDWPGLFIRGDEAAALSLNLGIILKSLHGPYPSDPSEDVTLLQAMHDLEDIKELIDKQVIVQSEDSRKRKKKS